MVMIPDSDINPLTVGRRPPLDASERTAGSDRCAPNDVAIIGIERPIDAALLPKAKKIPHQMGACPAKIEILARGDRTVRVCSCRPKTRYCPGVKAFQPPRPLDLSRFKIQRKGSVEEIVRRSAVRGGSCVLASFHICGCSVVVSGTEEERIALGMNRGWLPHRAAAVASRLSAIVRHVERLPEHHTGFHVKRD